MFLLPASNLPAQPPLIHAHNDYQKPEPLVNALRNKAFSIEADVYLVNDSLRVAHDKKELTNAPTLNVLYLKPIIDLFKLHHGRISNDSNYVPLLVIDIKEKGKEVLNKLVIELSKDRSVFDRDINPKAVQVVISGDRGSLPDWITYPSFILFDGRPLENYDNATLQKVAFISDLYINYSFPPDSIDSRVVRLVQKVHGSKKLLRLWAIPDNPESWTHLRQLGIDIINTDKVAECRKYFSSVAQ